MLTLLKKIIFMKIAKYVFYCFSFYILSLNSNPAFAHKLNDLDKLVGKRDAVVVVSPTGDILFSKNADQKLIPASTLKLLTALVAIHYLGADYRFKTECYMDQNSNLKVKGYGDPLLVSEALIDIAKALAGNWKNINDIVLDDSYFDQRLTIPGVTASSEPYDAPNGALCANFNTVNFQKDSNGNFISAEPQTPLLPFTLNRIKNSNMYKGRIVFTHRNNEATLYVGALLEHFLHEEGVECSGTIQTGAVDSSKDTLIYTYMSRYTLEQLIAELLEYSNNFIANQLLITTGAIAYGPPGSLEKGVRAVKTYARDILNIHKIDVIEGSGISRSNQISANTMMKILLKFKPYSYLMRYEKKEYYKTGTLKGIRTRAGYIENERSELYPFVVLVNTPGKTTHAIMKHLMNDLAK